MSAPDLITDLVIRQLPGTPLFSGLLGLNAVATDPVFGTKLARLTDGSSGNGNFLSMQTEDGPSERTMWNTDDTLIIARDTGSNGWLFQFNPVTYQGRQLGTAAPYKVNGHYCFSRVSPGVLYVANAGVVSAMNFALVSGVWTYQNTTLVCDFGSILPPGFNVNWMSGLGVSQGDAIFAMAFSEGPQDTGFLTCLYKPGAGFRMINTQTLEVTGDWGALGTAVLENTTLTNFHLHGINQTPNPAYVTLSAVEGGGHGSFVWKSDSLILTEDNLSGHHGLGFLSLYTGGPGDGQYDQAPYSTPAVHTAIVPKQAGPPGLPGYQQPKQHYTGDQHSAFSPIDENDESILWVTNGAPPVFPFGSCWEGEARGYDVTGAVSGAQGTVYRLCHTYNSGKSNEYITQNSQLGVSQTGNFLAFSSDMAGAGTVGPLGSVSGGATGVVGANDGTAARGDVIIVAVFSRSSGSISPSTTSLASSGSPATAGAAVSFTAGVSGSLANPPTGEISFFAALANGGGQFEIGSATLDDSQTATISVSTLPVGSYLVVAVYSGDAYNQPSTSPQVAESIVPSASTIAPVTAADPFDLLLNQVADIMVRDLVGTGDAYGQADPTFSTAASGVACRISMLGAGTDIELRAKSKEDVAYRKVLLRPWFADASPDGSYVPNWSYNGTTYNTEPLTHDHWFQINGEMYDIFELRNPGGMNHHLEALCRIVEV